MAKKVIIHIDKNGLVNAEINGVKGKKCLDYIALLEDIIEGTVLDKQYTQEYYQQDAVIDTDQNIYSDIKD